ncbi:hypothetical protein L6164_034556 [Bauhinia variegata]|uniref:Uncharacterized protein n=1 Tax=Bauhinia variegata TaxID=167791 RepID=A0ACB9KV94_BAUVA|nr:hypothetical protein L6164_034556 [Bauhinia variegata]
MSSSIVCQGLQSCLEPRPMEPRVLRLILSPPSSNFSLNIGWPSTELSLSDSYHSEEKSNSKETIINDEHDMKTETNADKGGWALLQSLADKSHCKKNEPESQQVYVHPMVKRSSSMLSGKSLEMCTESLGCETGSNASENDEDIALFSSENSTCLMNQCHSPDSEASKSRVSVSKRSKHRSVSFPPPLTSITDLGGVQVRPHREDGRLILKAVITPSPVPVFQAERSNGRLTLRLFEPFTCDSDSDYEADDEEIAEMESKDEHGENFQPKTHKQEDNEPEDDGCCGEELEGNTDNVEGEIGIRKFPILSRCKEGDNRNNGLLNQNWKHFCVAT